MFTGKSNAMQEKRAAKYVDEIFDDKCASVLVGEWRKRQGDADVGGHVWIYY